MALEQLLSFIIASAVLTILPGPDNIFVLTQSLTLGRREGVSISLGLVSGLIVHTFLAAFGISLLISQSPTAFAIIKYLGAAYIFYIALMALNERSNQEIQFNGSTPKERSFASLWAKGFVMNLLNPKVIIFFLAFFPQFLIKSSLPNHWQMVILGLCFMLIAFIIFSLIAFLAGSFSKYINKPRFWLMVKWVKFFVLTGIALALLLTSH